MVSCQLKGVTSDRAVKYEELPIRAMQKFRIKVRLKRINLEGNTHAQEINVSQCPV
jgi:hypothetical protein